MSVMIVDLCNRFNPNILRAMAGSEVAMEPKTINYAMCAMVLLLIGCPTMAAVQAGSEEKITAGAFEISNSDIGSESLENSHMEIPVLTTRLGFDSSGRWFKGQVVNLDLFAYNLKDIRKFRTNVKYDPKQLRLVYVSRGAFLVEDEDLAEWNSGVIDNQKGLAANISGIRSRSFSGKEITLIRLNFIVIDVGSGRISLENPRIVSSSGIERTFEFAPLQYEIYEDITPSL